MFRRLSSKGASPTVSVEPIDTSNSPVLEASSPTLSDVPLRSQPTERLRGASFHAESPIPPIQEEDPIEPPPLRSSPTFSSAPRRAPSVAQLPNTPKPAENENPLQAAILALSIASARLGDAAATAPPALRRHILQSKEAVDGQVKDMQLGGSVTTKFQPSYPSKTSFSSDQQTLSAVQDMKFIRKNLDPDAGNDFDEESASSAIDEMRRVRRQIRYLFGGFVGAEHKREYRSEDSARASKAWAQDLLSKYKKQ